MSGFWLRLAAIMILLLCLTSISYAAVNIAEVPDGSALLLAPMGLAALAAAEIRRRRIIGVQAKAGSVYLAVKRLTDITFSIIFLLSFLPIFIVLSILVKLDSPGPIFFRRKAVGFNGSSFDMYKFRSMVPNADEILKQNEALLAEYHENYKLKSDPRTTKLGRFLRKTSFDELPQLVNIFLGQMSFVGPRPIAEDEIAVYGPCYEQFKTVKPGLTGLWQTCGRSDTSYVARVRMDMLYIEKKSILYDIWLILTTIPAVIKKRGAF